MVIVSPSTSRVDYLLKQFYYMKYGVKEYWIADKDKIIAINYGDGYGDIESHMASYSYGAVIASKLFEGLQIDFKNFKDD